MSERTQPSHDKLKSFMLSGMAYSDLYLIRDIANRFSGCSWLDAGYMAEIGNIATTADRMISAIMKAAEDELSRTPK